MTADINLTESIIALKMSRHLSYLTSLENALFRLDSFEQHRRFIDQLTVLYQTQ